MPLKVKISGKIRRIGNSHYLNVPSAYLNMLEVGKEYVFLVEEKEANTNDPNN